MSQTPSNRIAKSLLVVGCILAIPIAPFLLAGNAVESFFHNWVLGWENPPVVFAMVVGILATDVLLPVPSSGLATWAGAELGWWAGASAVWLGLTVGAALGFCLARRWGEALARRLAGEHVLDELRGPSREYGVALLALTRPLPILAEATVLLLGAVQLPWRKFWFPVASANAAIALTYALLGQSAAEKEWFSLAIIFSLLAPLVLALQIRRRLARSRVQSPPSA